MTESTDLGLSALRCWISSFPQMAEHSDSDSPEFLSKLTEVAAEIFNVDAPTPSTPEEAQHQLHELLGSNGCPLSSQTTIEQSVLTSLLCQALSPSCENRTTYIERIMSMTDEVQRELMTIIQQNNSDNDVEETADYSMKSIIEGEESLQEEEDSDDELPDSTEILNRSLLQEEIEKLTSQSMDEVHEKEEDDTSVLEVSNMHVSNQVQQLKATIAKLQSDLTTTRENEQTLILQLDEMSATHKAEMIRLESQSIQSTRLLEEKYTTEISNLKRKHDQLAGADAKAAELKEEVTRLRDELDVLNFSKEKLAFTEEQLRKLKDRLEEIGDAKSALEREEKAHSASVEKCIVLENELAALKPLKRQLEQYKVRATDAEVALIECREDLRRLKERSCGLEGVNEELKRGVDAQMAEVGSFQRRLKEGEALESGGGVGIGMSELNPELMQELNMLRSEYARLKEFESQREDDNVQRLMESCDDAKRLSERFKEQFISTKGQLEDTQQLLHESKAREAKLREEVAGWTERHRKLGEEMKEERIKSHKAALDMERKFNDAKKALSEKACADLKDLSDKLTIKLENERKQNKEKLDRLGVERDELEKHFSQQLTELREQSSSHLRSTKESMQRRIDDLEQSKKDALEVADKEKKAELEALTQRGKGVLREKLRSADEKAKKKIEEANAQKNAFKEQLTKLEQFHVDFEEKAKIKIAKKTQQIKLLESQNEAAAAANSELEEKMQKAERTSKELIGENDRLRRQIGSRGPGGASQTQLEELVSVCNSLREENRRLKESSETNLFSDSAIYEPSTSPADSGSSTLGLSKTALIEYRQEFEERIQALEDDKRDLIMRNSAAMSDVQKAETRSWELEEELSKVKGELTTAKLVMQRHERKAELMNLGSNSKARKRVSSGLIKENATPNIHKRDFTPTAIQSSNKKSRTDVPSLMDYAKNGAKSSEGEQPGDCKQS
ncbi:hypothetical protein ACHAWO_009000 [Cyclotella atomus]|uniref:Uncharacterized protein n=1 Tax=Cyclotella atomus TaxID=382360 RepID=A0ABD3Q8U0_9STRA